MPPVVQASTVNNNQAEKPKKPLERRPELFCRVKYCNTLPDIPFDPKFLIYPFNTNRFVEYKQTSLEKNYKHDLLTEQDLGMTIDLINPETFEIDEYKNPRLAEEDEKLLEDEVAAPQDTKRSRCHSRPITWLKKTEYISTEFNRYGASSDKTETKVGFGVKKKMREENLYLDRDNQILAINKTFESAKKPIVSHPGKPGAKPVKEWPIFPDFSLWKYPFAQVMFDADPAPMDKEKEMSQAMIRGVMDESGEQFVAYFLPTEDCMNKRKIDELESRDYVENEEYEYVMAREYNWNVKNKATKGYEENYFWAFRDDAVYYNELETRVKLSKRRVKHNSTNSKLVVKHRPMNKTEYRTQEIRMMQLEPPQEEEEMNYEEDNVENQPNNDEDAPSDGDKQEEPEDKGEKRPVSDDEDESSDEKSESGSESESEPEERPSPKKSNKRQKQAEESESEKSSSASSESESEAEAKNSSSSASSEEDSDSDDDQRKRTKQEAADIFGSDSD